MNKTQCFIFGGGYDNSEIPEPVKIVAFPETIRLKDIRELSFINL